MKPDVEGAISLFISAHSYAHDKLIWDEVEAHRAANPSDFNESTFLRECAWVILCSGFSEKIVRKVFDFVSLCFCDWESAAAIVDCQECCVESALAAFKNKRKINAISRVAGLTKMRGFANLKTEIISSPFETLGKLPFVGPVTVFHLAKNLGVDVAKPDRHLARAAQRLGFDDTHHLCHALTVETGEQVKVIDLLIWRYLADNRVLVPTPAASL